MCVIVCVCASQMITSHTVPCSLPWEGLTWWFVAIYPDTLAVKLPGTLLLCWGDTEVMTYTSVPVFYMLLTLSRNNVIPTMFRIQWPDKGFSNTVTWSSLSLWPHFLHSYRTTFFGISLVQDLYICQANPPLPPLINPSSDFCLYGPTVFSCSTLPSNPHTELSSWWPPVSEVSSCFRTWEGLHEIDFLPVTYYGILGLFCFVFLKYLAMFQMNLYLE